MDTSFLTIEIKNQKPVELMDLSKGLAGLADEFRRHLVVHNPESDAADVRLYVREIRGGSIVADLIAISPQLFQAASSVNAVVTFAKYTKAALDYLIGRSEEKPELDRAAYQNLTNIVEPIAKDNGSQLIITHSNFYVSLNSTEANAAQNSARRELEKLKEPTNRLHEKVLLYWYQARVETNTKVGDKGIIESIATHPVKVICATDAIKTRMILDESNPFKEAYIVDVMVETINERPALYNILAIHDRIPKDPEPQ